ncbi:MAG TPA: gephyrin-like molybdotransferase Glp [Nitrososphaera sp.]|nr:gephyrin-like molybdotransferase Glp [Nitrososphaera sp.]
MKIKTPASLTQHAAHKKLSSHRKYNSISLALKKLLSKSKLARMSVGTEYVRLVEATDRILANRISCPIDIPPFQRSTVDGFAILSSDTKKATRDHHTMLDVVGKISAGKISRIRISSGKAVAIATGAKVPKGADSVIMIEDVIIENKGKKIFIPYKTNKGSNISPRGNDLRKGQILLREGTWLTAADIGLIASVGISKINVYKKIKVAVLSTGSELAEPGSNLGNASIFDSNRFMLSSMVRKHGGEPIDLGICRDQRSLIHARIMHALKFDVVLISGGSSVGEKDYVPSLINEIGKPGIIVSGIAMKPGSPTSLGIVNGKPVIVLPGYPVSAFVALYTFGLPLFYKILNTSGPPVAKQVAMLALDVKLHKGMTTFIRVRILKRRHGCFVAEPVSTTGASLLSTLAYSDGIVVAKYNNKGSQRDDMLHKGQNVEVILLRDVGTRRLNNC